MEEAVAVEEAVEEDEAVEEAVEEIETAQADVIFIFSFLCLLVV